MSERVNPKVYVNNMVVDATALAKDNYALAKAEMGPVAKHAGVGGGMFGAAGYLGANGVSLLFLAGGLGFGLLFAHLAGWGVIAATALGFVAMAVVLFLLAGILALLGKKQIAKAKSAPKESVTEAKKSVDAIKTSLKNGLTQVDVDIRDRKGLAQAKRAAKDVDTI